MIVQVWSIPKNEIELSWPIGWGVVCDENQTGQWHGQLYSYDLRQKQNWVVIIDRIDLRRKSDRTTTSLIIQVQSMPQTILNCMTNRIGCQLWRKPYRTTTWLIVQVWSMLKTKLRCHDRLDQMSSMMKTRQDNNVTDSIGAVYTENDTEL